MRRAMICRVGQHSVPYDRCMKILRRFKHLANLLEVKNELTKYFNCNYLNKSLPQINGHLYKCIDDIYAIDNMKKLQSEMIALINGTKEEPNPFSK